MAVSIVASIEHLFYNGQPITLRLWVKSFTNHV